MIEVVGRYIQDKIAAEVNEAGAFSLPKQEKIITGEISPFRLLTI